MKRKFSVVIGSFLLLGSLIIFQWQIHFANKHPETRGVWFSPPSGGPAVYPPDEYIQSTKAHQRIIISKVSGVVALLGFLLVYPELRRHMIKDNSSRVEKLFLAGIILLLVVMSLVEIFWKAT